MANTLMAVTLASRGGKHFSAVSRRSSADARLPAHEETVCISAGLEEGIVVSTGDIQWDADLLPSLATA